MEDMASRDHDPAVDFALDGTLPFAVAQLRHAYTHLHAERVLHQREFAEGLIAPVIRHLEAIISSAKPLERD